MPDKEKYENDVHNCTNLQLADLLDKIANRAENGMKRIEIAELETEVLRESAKRLRIKQRELFNSEQFNM